MAELTAGFVVDGRFRLESKLGRGGMGEIWRCRSLPHEEELAIKVLHAGLARDPELVARFEREIEHSRKVVHPNVVRVLEGGRSADDRLYLVMEVIRGRPLSAVAATEAPLPPARVVNLGRQIALGLAAAHEVGVIHRDLKPENIFVTRDDTAEHAVVFDFGLSLGDGKASRLTGHNLRLGTPPYMAPEYISLGSVDPRSDLYALGVVLFELSSGRMPFEGAAFQVMSDQITRDAPALASQCSAPAALCALVDRLLQREPADRPQTALAVATELEAT